MSPLVVDRFREILLATDWVQLLSDQAIARVLSSAFWRSYAPRESVANVGNLALTWVGVVDGLLKVSSVTASGRTLMITAAPGGSWLGEGSVIKQEQRKYELTAMRSSQVVHLPRSTFMWLLETQPGFNRYIIDHLNERSGQFLAMLEASRLTDPTARVAAAICNLLNPVLHPRSGAVIRMSQEELGEVAGLSRPSINGAVKRLKKLQLVHTQYGGLCVLDPHRLRDLVFHSGRP